MKNVTMYSTVSCKYCKMAEDFFKSNNVSYQKFDVGADLEKRREMVEKSGQMGVPVIDVGGEIVIGFDEMTLKQLLGIAK